MGFCGKRPFRPILGRQQVNKSWRSSKSSNSSNNSKKRTRNQPLLLEQLWDVEVDISSGQLNRIITEGKEVFHKEKADILRVGLEVSLYVHVNDTGARHQGKNGYATHVGNELFAFFESTGSKSRINFLEILRGGHEDYVVSDVALNFMRAQKLPTEHLENRAST